MEETSIVTQESVVENSTCDSEDTQDHKEIKGEDIYVENSLDSLDRMLGIPPSEEESELDSSEDEEVDHSDSKEVEDTSEDSVPYDIDEEEVTLLDFMEPNTENFTFLRKNGDIFNIESIPMTDKMEIKKAVRSPEYRFRYPILKLKDPVLGYSKLKENSYRVYFPGYIITMDVRPEDTIKEYQTFKEYFEALCLHTRPSNMKKTFYPAYIKITSLQVLETGLVVVNEGDKVRKYVQTDPNIDFYTVLDYIRSLSDSGEEEIILPFFLTFFTEL